MCHQIAAPYSLWQRCINATRCIFSEILLHKVDRQILKFINTRCKRKALQLIYLAIWILSSSPMRMKAYESYIYKTFCL